MKECVTHHHACDCREQKFAEMEAENCSLRKQMQYANGKLSEAILKMDELHELLYQPSAQRRESPAGGSRTMKSVQPNKSPRERREALLEKERASSCTVDSVVGELRSMVDGVYELVFAYKPESPAQAKWRQDWLEKAKRHGAGFDC
jgi:hypothetical protein